MLIGECRRRELLGRCHDQIDHEAGRLARSRHGRDHEVVGNAYRSSRVEDDARLAARDETESVGRNEAPALGPGARGELEVDLGQVDDDPVRIGEREDPQVHVGREIGDEARATLVADDSRVGDEVEIASCLRDGMGRRGGCEDHRNEERQEAARQ